MKIGPGRKKKNLFKLDQDLHPRSHLEWVHAGGPLQEATGGSSPDRIGRTPRPKVQEMKAVHVKEGELGGIPTSIDSLALLSWDDFSASIQCVARFKYFPNADIRQLLFVACAVCILFPSCFINLWEMREKKTSFTVNMREADSRHQKLFKLLQNF